MELLRFSVIVPVAREGESLYDRISLFASELGHLAVRHGFFYEILCVSDVYDRPTVWAMMRLAKRGLSKALFLTARVGKGGSIKNAMPYSMGDYIVLLDADMPVSAEVVYRAVLLTVRSSLDVLVPTRARRGHGVLRQLLSVAYNSVVNLLFRTGYRDHQAGFKVLSRRAALVILVGMTRTDGFAYDTEIIVWAKKHGLRHGTVNIAWNENREESTIAPLRALLTMLADLLVLRLLTLAGKHVALRRYGVGRVINLGNVHAVGREFTTAINVSGWKRFVVGVFRKLYVAVALYKRG
ncbi:MAG: glycosyltransferase [Desulfurococcales archaeon]|nr:glycosyltransferase [Desulfurococcales archaeon]